MMTDRSAGVPPAYFLTVNNRRDAGAPGAA
jgi:hypothetical protein